MDGLNQVTLIGNVGMDPELKYTTGGQAVLRLRVATNESWLDKAGSRQERTEWHTVIVWGKRAEGLNRVLVKGSGVWLVGQIRTRSWEDKEGGKRYATEINVERLGFTGGGARKDNERGDGGGRESGGQGRQDQGSYGAREGEGQGGFESGGYDDDIPF